MTKNRIWHYPSKQQYLTKKGSMIDKIPTPGDKSPDLNLPKKPLSIEDKVDLSSKSKVIQEDLKEVPQKVVGKVKEGISATAKLASEAKSVLGQAARSFIPDLLSGPVDILKSLGEVSKVTEFAPVAKSNKEYALIFMRGFDWNPFSDPEEGLGLLASQFPGSKVYGWNDEDQVIKAISELPKDRPLMLIGHGMGSDAAVNIVNTLNQAPHGFRQVDLLVTLDSIGFENDIIPGNVQENLNIISDQDYFLNDGPNIARDNERTTIQNILREETHAQLESSPDIQHLLFDKINGIVSDSMDTLDSEKIANTKASKSQNRKQALVNKYVQSNPKIDKEKSPL